jgi:hypothetical protein
MGETHGGAAAYRRRHVVAKDPGDKQGMQSRLLHVFGILHDHCRAKRGTAMRSLFSLLPSPYVFAI